MLVVAEITRKLHLHTTLLFFRRFRSDRRRRYFVRQWGARGVVASLQNDALAVHI